MQRSRRGVMRIIVTGERDWEDREIVEETLDSLLEAWPFTLVHGDCPTGADAFADEWQGSRIYRSSAIRRTGKPMAAPQGRKETVAWSTLARKWSSPSGAGVASAAGRSTASRTRCRAGFKCGSCQGRTLRKLYRELGLCVRLTHVLQTRLLPTRRPNPALTRAGDCPICLTRRHCRSGPASTLHRLRRSERPHALRHPSRSLRVRHRARLRVAQRRHTMRTECTLLASRGAQRLFRRCRSSRGFQVRSAMRTVLDAGTAKHLV
jgi:hypothetical protein